MPKRTPALVSLKHITYDTSDIKNFLSSDAIMDLCASATLPLVFTNIDKNSLYTALEQYSRVCPDAPVVTLLGWINDLDEENLALLD